MSARDRMRAEEREAEREDSGSAMDPSETTAAALADDSGGDDSSSTGSVTRDRGGAGAGGGGEPTVGVSDDPGDTDGSKTGSPAAEPQGQGSQDAGADGGQPGEIEGPGGAAPPAQGLEQETPDGQGFTPEERATTEAAQDLEQQVLDDNPGLDPSDVRIRRGDEENVIEAELTRTGEAARRQTVTRAGNDNNGDGGSVAPSRQTRETRTDGDAGATLSVEFTRSEQSALEGGDARLISEAQEQRRETATEEQFGDIPIENPITGNRIEEDLSSASDRFQETARGVLRRTGSVGTPIAGAPEARDDPTAGAQGAAADAVVDAADPFELVASGKEGVEFLADAVDRLPARNATNQERIDALTSGELPESDSRESFFEDVEERGSAVATATAERATSSPIEFATETAVGLAAGSGAATTGRRAASTAASRAPDVRSRISDELDVARTLRENNRAMANFPEQRTITRTKEAESDLDRLAAEVEDQSLRDRAKQRLPPREEFESDAAFQRELELTEQRLVERELDELADETQSQSTTQSLADDLDQRQRADSQAGGRARQREAEATARADIDEDALFAEVAGATAGAGEQLELTATQQQDVGLGLFADLDAQVGTQVGETVQTDVFDDLTQTGTQTGTQIETTTSIGETLTTGQTTTATQTTTTGRPPARSRSGRPDAERDNDLFGEQADDDADEPLAGVRDVEFVLDADPLDSDSSSNGGDII